MTGWSDQHNIAPATMETLIGIAELAYSRRVCSLNIFFDVFFKILYTLREDETNI